MLRKINDQRMKGFTLIELLIVMAVLGVLAVVVLIAINPAEQLRRARDSGRFSGVQQLGRAAMAFYVAQGDYPAPGGTWIDEMVGTGDLATVPADPAHPDVCGGAPNQEGWCMVGDGVGPPQEDIAVFAPLEAAQYLDPCGGVNAYTVFSTEDARGGWGCAVPQAGVSYVFQ